MKLNWDLERIKECKDKIMQKSHLEIYDKEILDAYNNILGLKKNYDEEEFLKNDYLTDSMCLEILKSYKEEYMYFISKYLTKEEEYNLVYAIRFLKNIFQDYDNIKLNKKNISNKQLYNTSSDVFQSISPYLDKVITYAYQNNLIQVTDDKESVSCCYNDIYNNLGFVKLTCFNDYYNSKESVLCHELGHLTMSVLGNGDFMYNKYLKYREFTSLYMQLYTDKYLYSKTNDNRYLISYYNCINYYKEMLVKFSIIDNLTKINGKLTKNKVLNSLQNNCDMEIDNLKILAEILDQDVASSLIYLLNMCHVINLMNQDDKEKVRRCFIDSVFTLHSTDKEFLDTICFNKNDELQFTNSFNETSVTLNKALRKSYKNHIK